MDYKQALDWIDSFQRFGIKLELKRIRYICRELGEPQQSYKVIHVGGTNGKGSVCRFLASVLKKNGYKVGVHTSPHLSKVNERFVVDNNKISNDKLVSVVEKVKGIVERYEGKTTYFEILTSAAFEYFKEENVDFAIIEVGLGGRHDATNIVEPLLTIITNVSVEHQKVLGEKIEDISFEKAGIIKNNVPVVTAAKNKSLDVIKKICKKKEASLTVVTENKWKRKKGDIFSQKFLINGKLKNYCISTNLLGNFQGENIAIVLFSVEKLQMQGVYITENSIEKSFADIKYPGRMELVKSKPFLLIDGAHNPAGLKALRHFLKNDAEYRKMIFVLGIMKDKNVKEMLSIIMSVSDILILTKPDNKRSCDPSEMKNMIEDMDPNKKTAIINKVSRGIKYAKSIAGESDFICITGSLFTVGEARESISCSELVREINQDCLNAYL